MSDHEAVLATMKCFNVPRYRNQATKDYMSNRRNYDQLGFDFIDELSEFEVWSASTNVKFFTNVFKDKVKELFDIHVPSKRECETETR